MAKMKGVGPYSQSLPRLNRLDDSVSNNTVGPISKRTRLTPGSYQLDIDTGNDMKGGGPLDRDAKR